MASIVLRDSTLKSITPNVFMHVYKRMDLAPTT